MSAEIVNDSDSQEVDFERKPAFQVHRFKKTVNIAVNEEMACELLDLLNDYDQLPTHLYAFRQKLDQKLNDGFVPQRAAG